MKKEVVWVACIASLLVFLGFLSGMLCSPKAHADMCSPMNGPGGFLWPAVQSCQVYAPQLGGIPRYYKTEEPATVPYYPQIPQLVPLPPIPPGLLP